MTLIQAAGLLKRAEGIVTLTLCNPNKKEEVEGVSTGDDPNAAGVEKIGITIFSRGCRI